MPGERPAVDLLRSIADHTRWEILSELATSDRRVGELVDRLGERQNLVSYHLRHLRDAGLVTARRSSHDGRDTYYRLELDRCRDAFSAAAGALHPALQLVPAVTTPDRRRRAPRVLFLCTGNSARSQMAEALLAHRAGAAVQARSAGSHPKALHPDAVHVMAGRGIDISRASTKHVRRFARSHFDHVVTLCDKVREVCPELPGDPVAHHWSIPDPSVEATGLGRRDASAVFDRTAAEIERRVDALIPQLFTTPAGGLVHAR